MKRMKTLSAWGGAVLLVFPFLWPATSYATHIAPDFTIAGGGGACTAPAVSKGDGSNGCVLYIGGPSNTLKDSHEYTENFFDPSVVNTFKIEDVSASDQARIEFIPGSVPSVKLVGAKVKRSAAPGATASTHATIKFRHEFNNAEALPAIDLTARHILSGSWSALKDTLAGDGVNKRDILGNSKVELCDVSPSSETCGDELTSLDQLAGKADEAKLSGSYSANSSTGFGPSTNTRKPFMEGVVDISRIGENSTESITVGLTIQAFDSSNVPPIAGTACNDLKHVGNIVAQAICVPVDELDPDGVTIISTVRFLPGPEALSLTAGRDCPENPGEEHRP